MDTWSFRKLKPSKFPLPPKKKERRKKPTRPKSNTTLNNTWKKHTHTHTQKQKTKHLAWQCPCCPSATPSVLFSISTPGASSEGFKRSSKAEKAASRRSSTASRRGESKASPCGEWVRSKRGGGGGEGMGNLPLKTPRIGEVNLLQTYSPCYPKS